MHFCFEASIRFVDCCLVVLAPWHARHRTRTCHHHPGDGSAAKCYQCVCGWHGTRPDKCPQFHNVVGATHTSRIDSTRASSWWTTQHPQCKAKQGRESHTAAGNDGFHEWIRRTGWNCPLATQTPPKLRSTHKPHHPHLHGTRGAHHFMATWRAPLFLSFPRLSSM